MTSRTTHVFKDELAHMDAVATAEAIRSGELHPREVIAAAVERALAVQPQLQAIVTDDYDRASRLANAPVTGPFAGVPTIIKDMIDVEGLPTRLGSRAFDRVGPATHTTAIAQQMFDMGMISLGKSSLPEFGFTPSAEFPDAEATRNPWNLKRSAGGSSSGSAALVAAGVLPIAHAADGGGSIRIPAGCCGLVGLKPTRGRLIPPPTDKLMPVQVVVDGVVTRTVRDTAMYFAEAEKRYYNRRLPRIGHVTAPLDRKLRFGAIIKSPVSDVDAPTRAVYEQTIKLLCGLGHEVEEIPVPVSDRFADDFIHYYGMLAFTVRNAGHRLFDPAFDYTRLTDLTHGLASRFRKNIMQTPGVILRLRRSTADLARTFERFDAVLSPTVGQLSPEIGHLGMHLPFDVVFPRVIEWASFTPLANASGVPSISLPLGHDAETNLPIGMMFTGGYGQDALLLQLALELEAAAPWRAIYH